MKTKDNIHLIRRCIGQQSDIRKTHEMHVYTCAFSE